MDLYSSGTITPEENYRPNPNSYLNPNRGAILLGDNCPDTTNISGKAKRDKSQAAMFLMDFFFRKITNKK